MFNLQGQAFERKTQHTLRPLSRFNQLTDFNQDGFLDIDGGRKGKWLYIPSEQRFKRDKTPQTAQISDLPTDYQDFAAKRKKASSKNRFLTINYLVHAQVYRKQLYNHQAPLDLNHDGHTDILINGAGSYGGEYHSTVLAYTPNGYVKANKRLKLPDNALIIYVGDINLDGRQDVLMAGDNGGLLSTPYWIYRKRNGLSKFISRRAPYAIRAFAVDFDLDKDPDFVLNNPRKRETEIYENLGNGDFKRIFKSFSWEANAIWITDINNDSMYDVIIGGAGKQFKKSVAVLVNQSKAKGNFLTLYPRASFPNLYAVNVLMKVACNDTTLMREPYWHGAPLIFSIGSSSQCDVEIDYGNNQIVTFDKLKANQTYTLYQNQKKVVGYQPAHSE